jgi:hypothetical protein
MAQPVPSHEEIQQVLDENSWLIKMIIKCQNDSRIMDVMLYQTRLQLNLVHLASVADSRPHPNAIPEAVRSVPPPATDAPLSSQVALSRFVRAVKQHGLKNIGYISSETSIPVDKIGSLAFAYIAYLKRENRFSEAAQLEAELSVNGLDRQ